MASCGCQIALTLNHGIQVSAPFCFVVLVVLLHVRHNFVPVVIVELFSGLCGDLSVECGTELLNVPALDPTYTSWKVGSVHTTCGVRVCGGAWLTAGRVACAATMVCGWPLYVY